MEEIIKIRDLSKKYDKKSTSYVLNKLNIDINKGDFVGIIGKSGVGKTTLLNIIGLLDNRYEGELLINGINYLKEKDSIKSKIRNTMFGYIFQEYAFLENATVLENILLPTKYNKKINKEDALNMALKLLIGLKIEKYKDTIVSKLSFGQRQRVMIARSLINGARIILADEPTSSLDNNNKEKVLNIFKHLNTRGYTIVLVTHDISSLKYCNKVIKIKEA